MKQLLNKWLKSVQLFKYRLNSGDLKLTFFGQNCVLCDSNIDVLQTTNIQPNGNAVCRACLNELPWHPKTSCPQCGLTSSSIGSNSTVCGSCISSPPDFDATHAVFLYQFPIDAMMQRYKYGHMLNLGDTFGRFLWDRVHPDLYLKNIDLIIPMPMHPARIKERGFNQALELAKVLNKLLAKNQKQKLDYTSAIRQKLTPPQASLPLKQRVKNIQGAFRVESDLAGKHIAIVDDVMTSGASLNELAKTLKKAGALHVECWVIARTLPHK